MSHLCHIYVTNRREEKRREKNKKRREKNKKRKELRIEERRGYIRRG